MTDFLPDEMLQRIDRIRSHMVSEKVDFFISSDAASVRYASGFRGEPRLLFISRDEVVLYTSFRSLPWARQQTKNVELLTCEDPLHEIYSRLPGTGIVGVDHNVGFNRMQELRKRISPHDVVASRAIDLARQIKSETEIALLRQSQKLNEEVFTAVLPKIGPGMSERAAQGMILAEIAGREDLDGYSFAPIVAAGSNAWEIHHLPDSTLLRKNDMVIIDLGVVFQGYASDMTRTVCLGKPTDRMREIYECVALAQDRAFKLVRPGVTNRELDTVAREVISQAGHGREYTHGLGHSIGLETHDPGLNLSQRAAEVPLETGMTLTIEPGIYLEGEFGVRLEDTIVIRPGGHENLTGQSLDLLSLDL